MSHTQIDPHTDFDAFYEKHAAAIERKHRVALAEITICCGENVLLNTRAACEKALELLTSGYFKRALVLNCSSSHRWGMSVARGLAAQPQFAKAPWDKLGIVTLGQGRLSRELWEIRDRIERTGVDVVLINSWEFASANARYREEAIFALRQLSCELNVTIIVYSQAAPKEYKPGCIMRGTLGRLSGIATIIGPVESGTAEEPQIEEHSDHYISEEGHLNGQPPVLEPIVEEVVDLELVE
jgi:hypothetical protein